MRVGKFLLQNHSFLRQRVAGIIPTSRCFCSTSGRDYAQRELEREIAETKRRNLLKAASGIDEVLALPKADNATELERVMEEDDEALKKHPQTPFLLPDDIDITENNELVRSWSSWGEYFALRGYEGDLKIKTTDRTLLQKITAALTCPLTMHAACEHLPRKILDKKHLVVYVLGAASQEETLVHHFWPELQSIMSDTFFEFVFIGPDLSENSQVQPIIQVNDKVTCAFMRNDYMSFRADVQRRIEENAEREKEEAEKVARELGEEAPEIVGADAMKPDLFFAFNAGFAQDSDLWQDTLEAVLSDDVLLVATANCPEDQKADVEFLESIGANFVNFEKGKKSMENPFSSRLLEMHCGRIARSNMYVHGVRGFSKEKMDNTLGRAFEIN
eukprot:g2730.t1